VETDEFLKPQIQKFDEFALAVQIADLRLASLLDP
jgi:hypothetical protein